MLLLILGALAVGITLGLLGSGGSAITVPLLVYVLGHSGKTAIAESMAIVGLISFFAAIPYSKGKNVDWPSVVFFGIPGMAGTLVGAELGGWADESIQLVVFGAVLLLASGFMIRKAFFSPSDENVTDNHPPADTSESHRPTFNRFDRAKMILEGLAVGVLTGFVGVGGGFLIVPALIILAKLPIRRAIGSSLVIIAAKSLVGFLKYQSVLSQMGLTIDWTSILIFAAIGVIAGNFGTRLNSKLDQKKLKQAFAIFLVLIGLFVIGKEAAGIFG